MAKVCGFGNKVVSDDEEGSYIENKITGTKTWLTKRGGVYFFELWVRKPEKGKSSDKGSRQTGDKKSDDGDVEMNEVSKKIGVIEQMLSKLQEGFIRQGIF